MARHYVRVCWSKYHELTWLIEPIPSWRTACIAFQYCVEQEVANYQLQSALLSWRVYVPRACFFLFFLLSGASGVGPPQLYSEADHTHRGTSPHHHPQLGQNRCAKRRRRAGARHTQRIARQKWHVLHVSCFPFLSWTWRGPCVLLCQVLAWVLGCHALSWIAFWHKMDLVLPYVCYTPVATVVNQVCTPPPFDLLWVCWRVSRSK